MYDAIRVVFLPNPQATLGGAGLFWMYANRAALFGGAARTTLFVALHVFVVARVPRPGIERESLEVCTSLFCLQQYVAGRLAQTASISANMQCIWSVLCVYVYVGAHVRVSTRVCVRAVVCAWRTLPCVCVRICIWHVHTLDTPKLVC